MLLSVSLEELQAIQTALRVAYSATGDDELARAILRLAPKIQDELDAVPKCPYTHAHTRHWCGYEGCRES